MRVSSKIYIHLMLLFTISRVECRLDFPDNCSGHIFLRCMCRVSPNRDESVLARAAWFYPCASYCAGLPLARKPLVKLPFRLR